MKSSTFVGLFVLLSLAAGCGPGPVGGPPLMVISTDPASNATQVSTRIDPSATFNMSLNSLTVTPATFLLTAGALPIPGSTSASTGAVAAFSPLAALCPFTAYTATLTTSISSAVADPPRRLASSYVWNFTTGDAVWDAQNVRVDAAPTGGWGSKPHVGFDASGNAIVVWEQLNATMTEWSIWASRRTPDLVWSAPAQVSGPPTGNQYQSNPDLAVSADGSAVVAWEQYDSTTGRTSVWGNRYVPGNGWSGAALLEMNDMWEAWEVSVATDSTGHAIVLWLQDVGGTFPNPDFGFQVYANRFTPGTGWSGPVRVSSVGVPFSTEGSGAAGTAHVAMNDAGVAFAVWQDEVSNTGYKVMASRFDPTGGTWGAPVFLDRCDPYMCGSNLGIEPRVAVDSTGNALAVWAQVTMASAGVAVLYGNRYAAGSWSTTPDTIEPFTTNASRPRIAMDPAGNAMVVWQQLTDPSQLYDIYAARYGIGTGWQAPVGIDDPTAGYEYRPMVAFDPAGNAIAVWDNQSNLYASRTLASSGAWSPETLVSMQNGSYDSDVATGPPCGGALAVWWGDQGVWAIDFR